MHPTLWGAILYFMAPQRSEVYHAFLPELIRDPANRKKRAVVLSAPFQTGLGARVHVVLRMTHHRDVGDGRQPTVAEVPSPRGDAGCDEPAFIDCAYVLPVLFGKARSDQPRSLLNCVGGPAIGMLPLSRMHAVEGCLFELITAPESRRPVDPNVFGRGSVIPGRDPELAELVISNEVLHSRRRVAVVVPMLRFAPAHRGLASRTVRAVDRDGTWTHAFVPLVEDVRSVDMRAMIRTPLPDRLTETDLSRVVDRVLLHLGVY